MKKIYLLPLFALSLAALPLAGCDDNSGDSSVPAAPSMEETGSTETPAPAEGAADTAAPAAAEEAAATDAAPMEATIAVTDARAYATAPSATTGAVFATISNSASKGDLLISAKTTVAARVEVHQSYEDPQTGAMLMRRTSGVDVPGNGSTKLEPTGFHIMLMNLGAPLKAGDTFDIELRFRDAGKVIVPVSVVAPGADAEGGEGHVQHESADHEDHAHGDHGTEEGTEEQDATASDATAEAVEEAPATDATTAQQ